MTSTVKVTAHCTQDKEVKITLVDYDGKEHVSYLQDGESYEGYVYDSRSISVEELSKDHDQ
jgi:hypothetical protein